VTPGGGIRPRSGNGSPTFKREGKSESRGIRSKLVYLLSTDGRVSRQSARGMHIMSAKGKNND